MALALGAQPSRRDLTDGYSARRNARLLRLTGGDAKSAAQKSAYLRS